MRSQTHPLTVASTARTIAWPRVKLLPPAKSCLPSWCGAQSMFEQLSTSPGVFKKARLYVKAFSIFFALVIFWSVVFLFVARFLVGYFLAIFWFVTGNRLCAAKSQV